ncbi:MAG TPA: molybdopterin-dependent oxidoreductase, partial [Candidatus Limnocylindrales bacterium]
GGVRALYIIGQDPLAPPAGPAPEIAAGLAGLDFLVVQDAFLTETAKLADVVLPGVTFAERDGTYTNLERRVQRLQPGVRPPGSARVDWAIVRDVANALGGSFDYAAPQEVMAELAVATPIYHGMTYSRIGDKGLTWPRPSVRAASAPVAAESTSV